MRVRRNETDGHRHQRRALFLTHPIPVGDIAALAGDEIVMCADFGVESLGERLGERGGLVGQSDDDKVIAAHVADEIFCRAQLIHDLAHDQRRKAQHLVARHKAIHVVERLDPRQPDVQKPPVLFSHQQAQLFFDELAAGQTGRRIGERFSLSAALSVLNAQAQLLDVERLGDIVVGA